MASCDTLEMTKAGLKILRGNGYTLSLSFLLQNPTVLRAEICSIKITNLLSSRASRGDHLFQSSQW